MDYDRLESLVLRVLILGALLLVAVGVIERAANVSDNYLIELAVALTVIVIALLLRQIRDQLRKS